MPEDRSFRVPGVLVDEHARDNSVAVEGLPVCEMGVGLSCIRGGVVPAKLLGGLTGRGSSRTILRLSGSSWPGPRGLLARY